MPLADLFGIDGERDDWIAERTRDIRKLEASRRDQRTRKLRLFTDQATVRAPFAPQTSGNAAQEPCGTGRSDRSQTLY